MLTLIALVIALLFLSWPWSVLVVIAAAIIDIAETGTFVWWSRRRRRRGPPAVGSGALVGRTGVAIDRLAPGGQVRVAGEIWNARSEVAIDPGSPVSVSGIDGLTLTVVPAPPQPQ
jgi:membrane protein implicated in regulation of membrane protease activity